MRVPTISACRSEKARIKSGRKASILSNRALMNADTLGLSRASIGRTVYPDTPTTRSPAPGRYSVSVVPSVRQRLRSGYSGTERFYAAFSCHILRVMSRSRALALVMLLSEALTMRAVSAQTRAAAPPLPARKVFTDITCASALGIGVKTKRLFCDVVITPTAAESVTMKLPPHTGSALLQFDLHNRFDLSTRVLAPILFARHLATVAILRS